VHHQTVQRCVERAVAYGPMAALDDRPRPGKEPTITAEAKAWLVSLACRKAKELGYPHELWTTRLLARHAREHGPAAGHECLANLVQGTVCKILDRHEVKPHKVRYYLERRDAEFEQKMAQVLCVYREVEVLKKAAAKSEKPSVACGHARNGSFANPVMRSSGSRTEATTRMVSSAAFRPAAIISSQVGSLSALPATTSGPTPTAAMSASCSPTPPITPR